MQDGSELVELTWGQHRRLAGGTDEHHPAVFDEHGEEPFPIRNVLAADSPLATPACLLADTDCCDPQARLGRSPGCLLTDSGSIRERCYRFQQIHGFPFPPCSDAYEKLESNLEGRSGESQRRSV
jgi:hypothetical protein